MIKKLRIQNFKAWKDTSAFDLKPITLFFGSNSSGKSSLIHFLLMMKLTAESSNREAVFQTGGPESPLDLGNFSDLLYRRDVKSALEFALDWVPLEARYFPNPPKNLKPGNKVLRLESRTRFHGKAESATPTVEHLSYSAENVSGKRIFVRMNHKAGDTYSAEAVPVSLEVNGPGKPVISDPPIKCYGFPDSFTVRFKNADYVRALNLAVEQLASRIFYLGPIRKRPSRLYHWSESRINSVGYEGEMTIGALLANANRKFSGSAKAPATPMHQHVAEALKAMGLIHSLKVEALNTGLRLYEVKVKISEAAAEVNLPDVGFGLSQLLPVLVQCYAAPANAILLIEQPELHLHPKAQARLANVLANVIRSFENGKRRNIQLIIETHSEHLLRRIQRLIAEDKLSHAEVACYNVSQEKSCAQLEPLKVTDQGYIENWPKDFFGDSMAEAVAHRQAALKKRATTPPGKTSSGGARTHG
ncbi:MAG: DUF3696 domain-containing protein [Puniceicoccales bacterium]|jgi:predicted ATPase|nr:DUF3696 domain-containing protein [Puniceicoccales bacterium]